MKTLTHRNSFLQLFPSLVHNLKYGVLKAFSDFDGSISEHSDLDLIIAQDDINSCIQRMASVEHVVQIQQMPFAHVNHIKLFFADQSYLEIDLIHHISRKGRVFMKAEQVLSRTVVSSYGWKMCSKVDSLVYLIRFFGLNGSKVPAKYRPHFEDLTALELEAFWQALGCEQQAFTATFWQSKNISTIARKALPAASKLNSLFWSIKQIPAYFRQIGSTISFSGVDGAGKSTLIQAMREILEQKYRCKLIVLRHRPSILPILSSFKYGKKEAEAQAAARLPRQGTNTSKLLSTLRFAYYGLDYVLGQFWIYFRYNLRGYTVLYDRYYFDFMVDPKRSNLALSPQLPKKLFAFIRKPQLNFLIYADADSILARKQELSKADIQSLTTAYKTLFTNCNERLRTGSYVAIENQDLDHSLAQLENHYLKQICHA